MDAEAANLVTDIGLGGVVIAILMRWVVPALNRILQRLGDFGAALTLLIASLPDIKKRSKLEAERLHKEFSLLPEEMDGDK